MAEASPEDSLNISRDTYSPAEGYFALHPEIYQQGIYHVISSWTKCDRRLCFKFLSLHLNPKCV